MSKFILEINLGNDAMHDVCDIRKALETAAREVQENPYLCGSIRDANGNKVGSWSCARLIIAGS
jgi:hypothetical protein